MARGLMNDPNRECLGLEPAWVEGTGGEPGPDPGDPEPNPTGKKEPEKLPGQHAGLDELANERGHTWSSDDLTVAEKQAELGGDS